jgi:arginyl-tRNA synthetase
METLTDFLTARVGKAFKAEGLEPSLGVVRVSDRPDLAQFQCNGALAAAKQAKKNPREIAEKITTALAGDDIFETVSIAGPGFLNLTLRDGFLAGRAQDLSADSNFGVWQAASSEKIIIDYGGPNVAKPLHVGHLRSAIIGESLKRLMRKAGHEVWGDIHLGDWGLQMGQLITQLEIEAPDLPYFDEGFTGPYPKQSPVTLDDLARLYPIAAEASKLDKSRKEAARKATAELQAGRPGYRALWQHFVRVSRIGLEREYRDLGVTFDLWKGESDADPFISKLAHLLEQRDLLIKSEGALVVPVAHESDKKDIPPLIMFTRDGAVLYGSTDLATLMDRKQAIDPNRVLYVVDQRQGQHFEQVFRAAALAGIFDKQQLEHIGFGTMNGKDGKPFKTRQGGVLKLRDLIDMVRERAAERLKEGGIGQSLSQEEREQVAHQVGMAALKFADLSNPRMTDYVFDLDRFLAFEGKTGPYVQYAAVRLKSVIAKAAQKGVREAGPLLITHKAERDLMLTLLAFADAHKLAHDKRMPHILCDHGFALAQAFSRFYAACRIADEADKAVQASRLTLAQSTLGQLSVILSLLGIDIPDRM